MISCVYIIIQVQLYIAAFLGGGGMCVVFCRDPVQVLECLQRFIFLFVLVLYDFIFP